MRRAWLTGTMALAALGLLAGCTPATYDLAAVSKDAQGQPQVELTLCKGEAAVGAFVMLHTDGPPESGWNTGIGGSHGRPGPFPLFSPPPDWEVNREGPQWLLPGYRYWVSYHAVDGTSVKYEVMSHFRAEDIEALGPDQVWAHGRAMGRKRYREYVKDEC
ncbi:hypothetical protein AB0F20_34370 [Streptomyces goshikiensis]|uniref:hypothetical protein n=1 Tax=Streptomyces goshikiensis TaxID=1942 RepID=UPI0033D60E10